MHQIVLRFESAGVHGFPIAVERTLGDERKIKWRHCYLKLPKTPNRHLVFARHLDSPARHVKFVLRLGSAELNSVTFPGALLRTHPPPARGHDGPNAFHQTEGPCALKKSIDRTEHAGHGEAQHKPAAPVLERVAHDHCRNGEKTEGSEGVHVRSV